MEVKSFTVASNHSFR